MDLGIAGKLALVTGGSSGLGLAVCKALAAEGVNLMVFARNPERLAEVAGDLRRRYQIDVGTFAGDMTKRESVEALGQQLDERGGADILILNTGRPPHPMRELLNETEDARWEDAYQTQLRGAILVLQEIAPQLVRKGWGRVVAITSASVKQPMGLHALSTVFRAGLMAALKHLANETAGKGLTVNSVCPASIVTEKFAKTFNLEDRAKRLAIGRLGTAEELAATVVFFASQHAGFISGQSLQVDGGETASLL